MSDSIETKVAVLQNNQNNIMDKLDEFQRDNKEQHQELKLMIEDALESKAGVWVERVLIWFARIMGAGVLSYLGYLIIKLIKQ